MRGFPFQDLSKAREGRIPVTLVNDCPSRDAGSPEFLIVSESSNIVPAYSTAMAAPVHIEIVGLKTSECSPFPCDEERTCGLAGCFPSGKLEDAFRELYFELRKTYGDRIDCKLTLIDDGVPAHIRRIIERDYPPIPMVLVNGFVTRIGRIALDRIKKEIEKEL